ncbi:cob(I)yrinic acid a,c-diamide adenosyltransferase [Bacteroidota bacterium]
MANLEKGFIQIYTGNGKGKTTAALGQALRAAGHGLKTYVAQFMKDYPYNELRGVKYLNKFITIEQFCNDDFVFKKESPGKDEIQQAKDGLNRAKDKMLSGNYDIIILDEVCVSVYFKLVEIDDLLPIFEAKPENVELILTGRYCPQEWIEKADLVTEMKEVKHYYQDGVKARKGIES